MAVDMTYIQACKVLRTRAEMSPADRDSPVFLGVAKMLEEYSDGMDHKQATIDKLNEVVEALNEKINALEKSLSKEQSMALKAHEERDRVMLGLMKAPVLKDTFSLVELSEFCARQHEWQEGARAELLREIDYGKTGDFKAG
jgi:glutamine synthetase